MCCRALRFVTVCCSVLQCVDLGVDVDGSADRSEVCGVELCGMLRCVVVCCGVLWCFLVCYRALQCVAVCCSVL